MPVKPSEQEEEYFARLEFDRRKEALAERQRLAGSEEGESDAPNFTLDTERQAQAARESENRNGGDTALRRGEVERRQIGKRIVHHDGEGAKRPGRLHVPDEHEATDDHPSDYDGSARRRVTRIDFCQ